MTFTTLRLYSLKFISWSLILLALTGTIVFNLRDRQLAITFLFSGLIGVLASSAISSLHKRVLELEDKLAKNESQNTP